MELNLKGRTALITGGSRGIGLGAARVLAQEGCNLHLASRTATDLEAASKQITAAFPVKVTCHALDLGSSENAARLARACGDIDILVNNAGEQHWDKDVTDISEEQLKRTFQTNVYGMFFMTQAARPHLKKGSAIINCTSVTMYKGSPLLLDYSATKGAITAFTRSLAKNLVKDGIRVNAVAPGPIWTPLNPFGGQPKEKIPEFGKDTPMGRPGQPNEVAPSFLFLACEDSSYMIGQVLHPDGGDSTSS